RGVFSDLFAESADLLTRVTGWNVTGEELRTVARRIVTAKKLYNVREGWSAKEDTLPRRFLQQRLVNGNATAALPPERLRDMIHAYYAARGWQTDGRVSARLIDELQLQDMVRS